MSSCIIRSTRRAEALGAIRVARLLFSFFLFSRNRVLVVSPRRVRTTFRDTEALADSDRLTTS